MADIDLSLGFTVEQASIRRIQSDINRALRDTTPEVNVQFAQNLGEQLKRTIGREGQAITIEELRLNPRLVDVVNREIGRAVERIEIREIDINQRALDAARREVAEIGLRFEALRDFEERRRARPGGTGAVGGAGPRLRQVTGVDPSISTEQATKLREQEGKKLAEALARERLIREAITVASQERLREEQAASQRIRDAQTDLRRGIISAAEAQRIAAKEIREGAAAQRERGEFDDATKRARDERNRLAQNLARRANAEQSLLDNFNQEQAAIKEQVQIIDRARSILNDLNNEYITTREAQRQINRILRTESAATTVSDPAIAQQLDAQRQKELGAAQNLVRFKEIQAENAKVASQQQEAIRRATEANRQVTQKLRDIRDQQARGEITASQAINRLRGLTVNALGTNARALQNAVSRNQANFQLIVQQEEAEKANLAALQEQLRERRAVTSELSRQAGLSKKVNDSIEDVGRAIQKNLVQQQQQGTRQFPQQQRNVAPNDVLFRNATDVTNFVNSLNPQEIERFTQSLRNIGGATNNAQRSIDGLGNSINNAGGGGGGGGLGGFNNNLRRGANLAESFGRQVGDAAQRLLAWAAPANLIFLTISRLRQAVNEIINIDRESRRLIFFRNVGTIITESTNSIAQNEDAINRLGAALNSSEINIQSISAATRELAVTNEQLGNEFSTTARIARQYGLSISTVQEALVTVARVGQEATDSTGRAASAFTDAALSLVRLERGALGANEAVRGLVAIQAQFFGGRGGTVFRALGDEAAQARIAVELTSQAAAILATTSAGSSASVSELTDAATRLGSAFVNLQGLNFPQTIAILGEAFTATGASTGRLATALRQSATLIKQNASEIRELTQLQEGGAVDIVDSTGTVRGFEAILAVLERVRDTAGTLEAVDLSLLIADRRNVADVQALAQNVDALKAAFERFNTPVERVNRAVAAQLALFDENEALANSLQGRIESLNVAFKELVSGAGVRQGLESILNVVGALIGGFDTVISVATKFSGLLAALAGAGLARAAKFAFDLSRGLLFSFTQASRTAKAIKEAESQIKLAQTTQEGLNALVERGLLTQGQVLRANQLLEGIRRQQAQSLATQLQIRRQIALEELKQGDNTQRITFLQGKLNDALRQAVLLREQEEAALLGIQKNVQSIQAAEATRQRGRSRLGGAALILGTVASQAASEAEATGSEIGGRISSGINAAIVGGLLGSVVPGIGTALGAAIGGLIGVANEEISSLFNTISDRFGGAEEELEVSKSAKAIARQIDLQLDAVNEKLQESNLLNRIGLEAQKARLEAFREEVGLLEKREKLQADELAASGRSEGEVGVGTQAALGSIPIIGAALNAAIIAKNASVRKRSLAITERELVGIRSREASEAENLRTLEQAEENEKIRLQTIEKANSLLEENRRLSAIIVDTTSTEEQVRSAIERREKVSAELKKENIAQTREVLDALKESERALIRQNIQQQELNRRISFQNNLIQGLAGAFGDFPELQFELNDEAFRRRIREIKIQRDLQLQAAKDTASVGEDISEKTRQLEFKAAQDIAALLGTRFGEIVKDQQQIVDSATERAQAQIKAWETAAKSITSAFDDVVDRQIELADAFGKIGQLNSEKLERSFESISRFLEDTGASVATRLTAIARNASAELRQARGVARQRAGTLGDRFRDSGEVSVGLNRVIDALVASANTADQEIVSRRGNIIREEIAFSRQIANAEKADFQRRISETQREISIRRDLLNREIEILDTRLEAERELNQLRREQLQQFGDLLIDSPQEFKKELDNIRLAERFFAGITDLSEENLRIIRRRAERLREGGRGDLVGQIRDGLESAVSFGRPDVISGVGNQQLRQIFAAAQSDSVAGIGEVAELVRSQNQESRVQQEIQRQIEEKQNELFKLSQDDFSLQQAQLRLSQVTSNIAIQQRDAIRLKLDELLAAQITAREDLEAARQGILDIFQTSGNQEQIIERLLGGSAVERRVGELFQRVITTFEASGLNNLSAQFLELGFATADIQRQLADSAKEEADQRRIAIDEGVKLTQAEVAQREELEKLTQAQRALTEITNQSVRSSGAPAAGFGTANVGRQDIADITKEIRQQVEGVRGNAFRFESNRILELQRRQRRGGQLTADERRELSQRQRFAGRNFGRSEGDIRQFTRRLLQDEGEFDKVVGSFRSTLLDTQQDNQEFIDRARRLRGEGGRGRRNIDVGAVQRFLRGAGFEGAAARATTRGSAAKILDDFIDLSQRLAKEQGEISRTTQKEIVKILSAELSPGIQRIVSETSAAIPNQQLGSTIDNLLVASNKLSEAAAIEAQRSEQTTEVVTKAIKEVFTEGTKEVTAGFKGALDESAQKLANTAIKVDPVDVKAEIAVSIPQALSTEEVSRLLAEAFSPIVGTAQLQEAFARNLRRVIVELTRRGIIPSLLDDLTPPTVLGP